MAPKGGIVVDLTDVMARIKSSVRSVISSVTPASWMSPGQPLQPVAPDGTPSRGWDFPVGFNTQTKPRATAKIDFSTLRNLAETCDILRLVIETRKDQMEALDWQIRPRPDSAASPDDPRVAQIHAFFQKPDKRLSWNGWLRAMLEDLFVLDAVAIEKRRDRVGRLYSLDLINAATIAVKLDDTGRMPMAPDVAYQQIIKGVPAINFTTDELIYAMRNPRTDSPYGRSPVEQIITTVNIALRRSASQLSYYTDGNINTGIAWLPKEWSADVVAGFQAWWDTTHGANETGRHKMKFLPGDRDSFQQIVQPPLKDQYDEWLARVICFAFSVSPQPFVAQMNRATADTAHQAALEEGLAPIQRWVKGEMDQIITEEFGAGDLEFVFIDDREIDPMAAAQIADIRVKNGTMTVNEVRAENGQDPYVNGVGDAPAVLTMSGYVAIPSQDLLDAQHEAALVGSKNAALAPAQDGEKAAVGGAAEQDGDVAKGITSSLKKKYTDPLSTGAAKASITAIRDRVSGIFTDAAHHVATQLRGFHVLGKADGDDEAAAKAKAQKAVDDLDLFGIKDLKTISGSLTDVFADAQATKLDTLGVDVGLFGQINTQAAEWAQDHAAALVSQISDTTRDQLRATIAQGFADGLDINHIADRIAASPAFSADRASLIANTETAMASGEGSLAGFRRARALGIKVKKQWLDDPEACTVCRTNADAGPIDIDDSFPDGSMTVPSHPRCSCAVISIIED